jgi:hypothetical protein
MTPDTLRVVETARESGKGIAWLVRQLYRLNVQKDDSIHVATEFAELRGITSEVVQQTIARVYKAEPRTQVPTHVQTLKIDGRSLLQQEFPPLRFVIDGFLQPGFTVLACRPKFGKSFLSLQIAIAVATGQPAFGRFKVLRPGKVLFYSLEDSPRRNRDRIRGLAPSDDALDNIRFVFGVSNKLMSGGGDEIESEIVSYKPALVIIDPFLMLANAKQGNNFVRSEYEEMSYFRELSARYELPVLLVHHTAKQESEYTLDSIIGSTGTTAPMDAWIAFKQKEGRITLDIGGKDGEGRVLAVERERNGGWRVLGDAIEHVENPEYQQILSLLDERGPLKPADIAATLKKDAANVRTWVNRMKGKELVIAMDDGRYCRKPVFGMNVPDNEPNESVPDDFLKVA